MNNRIYTKDVFLKAMDDYLKGKYYCPHCFSNDIGDVDKNGIVYLQDVKCFSCGKLFKSSLRLSKQDVRGKKIDRVLKK